MGLFVLPKSDSLDDIVEAVIGNIKLFRGYNSSMHLLENAEMYIQDLKVYAQKAIDEEKARDDAYYAKKATYPLCVNCENFKYRAHEDIDVSANKYAMYCDEVPFEEYAKQIGRKFSSYDNGVPCSEFKWKVKDENESH